MVPVAACGGSAAVIRFTLAVTTRLELAAPVEQA